MCGINGVFHYRGGGLADPDLVARQANLMRHRGPDDYGLWHEKGAALAQRRLAIVDLSPGGHQPIANEDASVWVTYNGELYNWPEVKGTLLARGHRFRGNCDVEMILHLYEEHGDAVVEHLRGMFAFALVDRTRRRLLLARDRVGKKPLFYHDDGERIVFASEIKALLLDPSVPREMNEEALADYLTFQYVPSPETIWKGVRRIPPAHRLIADANGVRVERYWSLPVETDPGHSEEFYRERLRALLQEAVRIRLMSDVPLGAFLSGGIDSSVVTALMARVVHEPVKTFSIGFEEQDVSELEHARRVARHLGTDHHELIVRPRALELLPRLVWQMDEPFADASMIPTYYVSEMARRHVKVALSGDGGDEAYGGYVTYPWARRYAALDRVPRALRSLAALPSAWLHPDHGLGRKLHRLPLSIVDRHLEVMSFFPPRELGRVLSRDLAARLGRHDPYAQAREQYARARAAVGEVPALLYLDAVTYMTDDVLVKVDRTAMLNSLEVRCPLLDHEVLEFVARIPFEHKLKGEVSKWILKEVGRDLLPVETMARGKQGFGMPLERWLGADFGRLAREVLLDPRARGRGWFDPAGVARVLEGSGARDERRAYQVWSLVCLELWAQTYLDRAGDAIAEPLAALPTFDRRPSASGVTAAA
ncbi:MAG: asparagine synthase (glutamine-hydrolyzing) [Candidatus Eisenbacteria bacterium]|uniref:asparagine synthase (glutamine-hydrolyzing) n=1 Tax=Eiseniibacteriota bacterium TaxID=2212470 RepID=A0A9D6QJK5_UNCEI|nr:asparagine synthase (glutamine-hydrolyzing) [Candidatus Eisenbacteria bacterium]MBI3539360.1 asparagine synthase (glutamine-hydrolyzing) [Candidatus Eisenbacteria bacterium]